MAQDAVANRNVSIRLACAAFCISETCYRYQRVNDDENAAIADLLVDLTEKETDWGFGLCFHYLRNVKGRIFSYDKRRRFFMKTSKFTDSQIMAILKQAEAGAPVPELCREHGMSAATFYKWRAKFGGMDASLMARLKELEAENARLKKMYAEERLKAEVIQEAMAKKW